MNRRGFFGMLAVIAAAPLAAIGLIKTVRERPTFMIRDGVEWQMSGSYMRDGVLHIYSSDDGYMESSPGTRIDCNADTYFDGEGWQPTPMADFDIRKVK